MDELAERLERLCRISLFSDIVHDQQSMRDIACLFRKKTYREGEEIITEGRHGNELYILKAGIVAVEKKTLQGDPYTVTALSADANDFFGEMALLDDDRRSATVRCTTQVEAFLLSREDFLLLGNRNPLAGLAVTRALSRILCKRLRKANQDIITLFGALVEEMSESGGVGGVE